MKILQLFNRYEYFGGEERSVQSIGTALRERHEVDDFITSTKELLERGWPEKAWVLRDLFRNATVERRLEDLVAQNRFDLWIVHNVFPGMSPVAYEVAFRHRIPVIQYLHNYRFACAPGPFFRDGKPCFECIGGHFFPAVRHRCWRGSRVASGLQALVLHRCRKLDLFGRLSGWFAVSERQKDLHARMGIPEHALHVLPHFLEHHTPPPAPNPQGHVVFIGRLSPEKGAHLLLDAWQRLGDTGRDLMIAGTGPEEPALRSFVASARIPRVRFLGFVEEKDQQMLWQGASMAVVPSVCEETFGMVVLEAWARQRSVVVTRMGGLPELVQHGKTGWICEPDPESLAAALRVALSSPPDLIAAGEAGHRELALRFTKTAWLNRFDRETANILASAGG